MLGQAPEDVRTVGGGQLAIVAVGKFQDVQAAVGHVGDAQAGRVEPRVDDRARVSERAERTASRDRGARACR